MEDDWNYLIGTNRVDYYEVCYDEISCDLGDLLLNPNPECEFIVVCANYPVQINTKSDGYIDASSQQGHMYTQKPTHVERALGVNHHELYFHETPKRIIEDAFAGEYGQFFSTDSRN